MDNTASSAFGNFPMPDSSFPTTAPSESTTAPDFSWSYSPPAPIPTWSTSEFDKSFQSAQNTFDTFLTLFIVIPIILCIIGCCVGIWYCQSREKKKKAEEERRANMPNPVDIPGAIYIQPQATPAVYTPQPAVYQPRVVLSPSAPTATHYTTMDNRPFLAVEPTAPTADTAMRKHMLGTNTYQPPQSLPTSANNVWDDPAIVTSRLPFDTVQAIELIGSGAFAEVYMGTYRDQIVAIKKLRPELRRDLKRISAFLTEAKFMCQLEHERIVHYIGVVWDALSDVGVVCEYMEGGDLRALLNRFGAGGDGEQPRAHGFDSEKMKIAMHVAEAITFMHSMSPVVIHRDLKSRNVLLDADRNAKLADFGISREHDQTMTARVGTMYWMAPEVMSGERYDEKADVFSLGVVLSELDTHEMPYAHIRGTNGNVVSETSILQKVISGQATVKFSSALSQELVVLGLSCVAVNPLDRPTAAQVLYELRRVVSTEGSIGVTVM